MAAYPMIYIGLLRLIDIEYENTGEVSVATITQVREALALIDHPPTTAQRNSP